MINDLIVKTLSPLNIPIYFISRLENSVPCIVFNFIKSPSKFSDNNVDLNEYIILVNLYIEPTKYIEVSNQLCSLMADNGFIESIYPTGMYDELLGVYNQPIQFKFYK